MTHAKRWMLASLVTSLTTTLAMGCAPQEHPIEEGNDQARPGAEVAAHTPLSLIEDHSGHDHSHGERLLIQHAELLAQDIPSAQSAHITLERPIMQLGVWLDGEAPESLEFRARSIDGVWSEWSSLEITWSEDLFHVGRAILTEPAVEVEFRGGESLTYASAEFHEEILANTDTLAVDLEFEAPAHAISTQDGALRSVTQAVAPSSLVIDRASWGARSPGKVCGSVVAPYRMSIHHTASPDSDGGDPAARMRQMQAFHMDTRGWCDIGYHFVVSQSGKLYQGRSDERRPGAHVGNNNAGNIGISFIGNYQSAQPPQKQLEAAAELMKWLKDNYDIAWNRDKVKGHREWPGQTTSCPGSNLLAKIPDLMDMAVNGSAPKTWSIPMKVNWLEGKGNVHTQGTGEAIADVFPGDTFEAEIVITNDNPDPIRGVQVGYLIENPYIEAIDYTIQTDHPAKDKKTWVTNDADASPDNPGKDMLGKTGALTMHAFGAGETKRILLTLKAKRYSLGAIDHPDVRGWAKHIDLLYGEQDSWNQEPAANAVGGLIQAYAQIDVLSRAEWQFDHGEKDNTEGWVGCNGEGQIDKLHVTDSTNALAAHVVGEDSCIKSPSWTRIDADRWDQLVIRMRSHDGAHRSGIYWAREGESFSGDRVVRFEAPGDGEFHTLVIPMAEHPEWSGEITQLRVDPLEANTPAVEESGWYDFDALFFQSSGEMKTNSAREDFVAQDPVDISTTGDLDPGDQDPMNPDEDPTVDPGSGGGGQPVDDPELEDDETRILVNNGGCTSAPGAPSPADASWLLAALGALLARRKKR